MLRYCHLEPLTSHYILNALGAWVLLLTHPLSNITLCALFNVLGFGCSAALFTWKHSLPLQFTLPTLTTKHIQAFKREILSPFYLTYHCLSLIGFTLVFLIWFYLVGVLHLVAWKPYGCKKVKTGLDILSTLVELAS